MKVLRARGFGVTGTCRTNLGIILELVNIKKNNKGINELLWGMLISMLTASNLVNQYD
jgi:hypothetical protein